MNRARAIDVHAHVLGDDTIRILQKEAPAIGLKLTPLDDESGVLEFAGHAYRPFPRGAWDLERRFKDMAFAEVDMQVVSNTPQTFLYNQEPRLTAATSAIQNDHIAELVRRHPDRFLGMATLPMQAPELAAQELQRAMHKLGFVGAQIGSNVNGKNLDDPALEPLWQAADALGAFLMVHPTGVAGADRLKSYYLANLIGNPLDTTIAAASLVFGGVIERYPRIIFFMVHGGGFVPYQAGRWVHGFNVRPEPQARLKQSPEASLDKFIYDTILHAQAPLEFLVKTVGTPRVLLGSDYPFDMGTLECARQVRALSIPEADKQSILAGRARTLFGTRAANSPAGAGR
jgi:aminocarboxymuconate-semialdehyde decarboxylase